MFSSTCLSGGWNRPTLYMVKMNWAALFDMAACNRRSIVGIGRHPARRK